MRASTRTVMDQIRTVAEDMRELEAAAEAKRSELSELVRIAARGVDAPSYQQIADAAGFTKSRIYQIVQRRD